MSGGLDLEVLASELAAVISERVAAEIAPLKARVDALEHVAFLADALNGDGGAE